MVYFKITNGEETRKFQVTPGEITFQQLKERIDTLFPEASKRTPDLVLRYRDAEGDIITLSTDEEFQEVLSNLPENHIWKLHLTPPAVKRQQSGTGFSVLDHILGASWPSLNLTSNPVSEVEELIDFLLGLPETTSSAKSGEKDTPTAEDQQQSNSNEGAEPESPEAQDSAERSSSDEASPGKDSEEEVKSKQSASSEEARSEESLPRCPAAGHCYRVKRVGLWDPFLLGGLFGPSRVFNAPVGYHITWRPRTSTSAPCA